MVTNDKTTNFREFRKVTKQTAAKPAREAKTISNRQTRNFGDEKVSVFQNCYIILLNMSSFQQKNVQYMPKIERRKKVLIIHRKNKINKNFEVFEEAQTLDLLDKGIKSSMINMSKNLKETMFTKLKGSMRIVCCQLSIQYP